MFSESIRMTQFKQFAGDKIPDAVMRWLEDAGYFKAPAAAKHHGAVEGGLFEHSMVVAKKLCEMTEQMGLKWERECSPMIVGLLHDICKIDEYVLKNTLTGAEIEYNNNKNCWAGHGEKSVMMLMELCDKDFFLTAEEIACIRYHMGAFVEKSEWSCYSRAVQQYPNVLWTHTADMYAANVVGK